MSISLEKEIFLDDDIFAHKTYEVVTQVQSIFITGSTGFVGTFLIAELLKKTQANLYCLVRSENINLGKKRLLDNLSYYQLSQQGSERINVVIGNLEKPFFGLRHEEYNHLAKSVEVIYHVGASVSFIPSYEKLKPINVLGTQQCLRLACTGRIKAVHYVSTYAVFNTTSYNTHKIVYEKSLTNNSLGLRRGYGQSKWVAEKICEVAKQRNIPVTIYRLGIVSGDSRTGIQNLSDIIAMTISASLEMGYAIDIDFLLHLTPVDYCSQAIVNLSLDPHSYNNLFHLIQEHPISWQQLIDWLIDQGYFLNRVSPSEWYKQIKQLCHENSFFLPVLAVLSMDEKRSFWNNSNIFSLNFDSSNTKKILPKKDRCPKLIDQVLNNYIKHLNLK